MGLFGSTPKMREFGEFSAINTVFAGLAAGELCLILIDQVEEVMPYIVQKVTGSCVVRFYFSVFSGVMKRGPSPANGTAASMMSGNGAVRSILSNRPVFNR